MSTRGPYAIRPTPLIALAPEKIALALDIAPRKIRAAIKSGLLPAYRDPSGRVRVIVVDCENFIRKHWRQVCPTKPEAPKIKCTS